MGIGFNKRLSEGRQKGVRGEAGLDLVQLPVPLGPAVSKAELLLSYRDFINHTERIKMGGKNAEI